MEVLLIAFVLSILLMLQSPRASVAQTYLPPPAIRRQVNIEELRGFAGPIDAVPGPVFQPGCAGAATRVVLAPNVCQERKSPKRRFMGPTIEEDRIERLTCEGEQLILLARGELLLIRTVTRPNSQ